MSGEERDRRSLETDSLLKLLRLVGEDAVKPIAEAIPRVSNRSSLAFLVANLETAGSLSAMPVLETVLTEANPDGKLKYVDVLEYAAVVSSVLALEHRVEGPLSAYRTAIRLAGDHHNVVYPAERLALWRPEEGIGILLGLLESPGDLSQFAGIKLGHLAGLEEEEEEPDYDADRSTRKRFWDAWWVANRATIVEDGGKSLRREYLKEIKRWRE